MGIQSLIPLLLLLQLCMLVRLEGDCEPYIPFSKGIYCSASLLRAADHHILPLWPAVYSEKMSIAVAIRCCNAYNAHLGLDMNCVATPLHNCMHRATAYDSLLLGIPLCWTRATGYCRISFIFSMCDRLLGGATLMLHTLACFHLHLIDANLC
jgi:hypothetical protein